MPKSKIIPSESINILGFDPSTDITGAAFVRFPLHGEPEILDSIAIDARATCKGDGLANRMVRVRWTREQLYDWLSRLEQRVDAVYFEPDTGRGFAASEALKFATGAYLSLPHLALQSLDPISRQKACIAAGCLHEYRAPKGKTRAEQDAKTLMLKTAVRVAMDRVFPSAGLVNEATDTEQGRKIAEAIADALAITVAAGNDWKEAQRILALPRQPKLPAVRRKKEAVS